MHIAAPEERRLARSSHQCCCLSATTLACIDTMLPGSTTGSMKEGSLAIELLHFLSLLFSARAGRLRTRAGPEVGIVSNQLRHDGVCIIASSKSPVRQHQRRLHCYRRLMRPAPARRRCLHHCRAPRLLQRCRQHPTAAQACCHPRRALRLLLQTGCCSCCRRCLCRWSAQQRAPPHPGAGCRCQHRWPTQRHHHLPSLVRQQVQRDQRWEQQQGALLVRPPLLRLCPS